MGFSFHPGSLYAQLNKTMDMDDYAPVEILNAYLDMMGQQLVTVGSASARGRDSTDTPGALIDEGSACNTQSTETPGPLGEVDEEQEAMRCDEIEQQIAIISDLSADSEVRVSEFIISDLSADSEVRVSDSITSDLSADSEVSECLLQNYNVDACVQFYVVKLFLC